MRLAHTILLTIPAGALGARAVQQTVPGFAAAPAAEEVLTVRGDRARAAAIQAALGDLDGEILLGAASCEASVIAQADRTTRYDAGTRRYDNPDYTALAEQKATLDAALSALSAEESALRATLPVQAERESLQLGRAEQAARDLRDTERDLRAAREELSTTSGRLSRARDASAAIAAHTQQQRALASEISTLRADIDALRAQLATAEAAPAPHTTITTAEARLHTATTVAELANAAMRAEREEPTLADDARHALRAAARAARAELVAAEAEVLAMLEIAPQVDAPNHHHLGRRLRRLEDALAAAESARAALRTPDTSEHELASRLPRLEQRQRRQSARVAEVEQDIAQRSQRVAVEEIRATELAHQRAEQESALSALMAAEEEQRAVVLRVEASLASLPRSRSRTRWEEASYTVETWERTCQVSATVIWPDGGFTQLTAETRDADDAYSAIADARLTADPLDYDRTDTERIQDADRDLIAQLRATTRGALAASADTGF